MQSNTVNRCWLCSDYNCNFAPLWESILFSDSSFCNYCHSILYFLEISAIIWTGVFCIDTTGFLRPGHKYKYSENSTFLSQCFWWACSVNFICFLSDLSMCCVMNDYIIIHVYCMSHLYSGHGTAVCFNYSAVPKDGDLRTQCSIKVSVA